MNKLWDEVVRHVDADGVIELSRQALAIKSTSGEEEKVARFFVEAMTKVGLETELQPVPPCALMGPSYNAIGRLKGTGGGASLMFNGHIDHNPVSDGWTKDPFGGVIEDGWLYGFIHMKAADAAYVMAVDAVRRAGIPLKGDVVVALVAGELRGGAGTQHALRSGIKTDYFILGEPSELEIALTHTASIIVRLHVLGRSKHFSTIDVPDARGVNAVEKMAKAIPVIGPSHRQIPSRDEGGWLTYQPVPGFEGLPQLNIGPIRGGIGREHMPTRPALFPDFCTLTLDFRIVPGMTKETIRADLVRRLEPLTREDADFRYEIEFGLDTFPLPFVGSRESAVTRSTAAAHRHLTGQEPPDAVPIKFAASDASWLAHAGIQGLIYGPAGRYLSRPDERCETADLVRAAQVYACVLADICTRDSPGA